MSKYLTRKELDALLVNVERCNEGDMLDALCKAHELADRLVEARVDAEVIHKLMQGKAGVSWDENGDEHWQVYA